MVQRWFNESRGKARDTASLTGLAGEKRMVPRSKGKGTGEGTKPGMSKARGGRLVVCFRTQRGQRRIRAVTAPYTGHGVPGDEHARTEGPTSAPEPPLGSRVLPAGQRDVGPGMRLGAGWRDMEGSQVPGRGPSMAFLVHRRPRTAKSQHGEKTSVALSCAGEPTGSADAH